MSDDERSTVVVAGVINEVTDNEHRVAVLKAQVTAKVDAIAIPVSGSRDSAVRDADYECSDHRIYAA